MAEAVAAPSALDEVRNLFLGASNKPRKVESVDVPGFGKVWVKGLTAAEYDDYEDGCVEEVDGIMKRKANRPLLLRLCVVTADGKKVFRDDQVEMLSGLDSWIVNPIAQKAINMCGAGAKEAEDIAKN